MSLYNLYLLDNLSLHSFRGVLHFPPRDSEGTVLKKPYQTHRMTPASAYWHYLKSFCAFGIPEIEPLYMKKDAMVALPGIFKALCDLRVAGYPVDVTYDFYTERDFIVFVSRGDVSYFKLLKMILGRQTSLSTLPYSPKFLETVEKVHAIMAPIREEMNRLAYSKHHMMAEKPWVRIRINNYAEGNRQRPLDLHPATAKEFVKAHRETKYLPKEAMEYGITKDRDRFLSYHNIYDVSSRARNAFQMPLSSFDNGLPFPSSIPLHIALPNFSHNLRFICERTFGRNKMVRLYPVRQDSDGTVYVIPIPQKRLERYMHAECALVPGKNPHKDQFIAHYKSLIRNGSSDSANRLLFVARVVNGSVTDDGYYTAHWFRTPPQHGGGVRNVLAHVYGINEHEYVLGQGRT